MKALRKWDYKTHQYMPYEVPDKWHISQIEESEEILKGGFEDEKELSSEL